MLTGVSPMVALLCPIALCSTWLHVPMSQPWLASECCWGLLLAHDLLLWWDVQLALALSDAAQALLCQANPAVAGPVALLAMSPDCRAGGSRWYP